jgi:hypothetical protein
MIFHAFINIWDLILVTKFRDHLMRRSKLLKYYKKSIFGIRSEWGVWVRRRDLVEPLPVGTVTYWEVIAVAGGVLVGLGRVVAALLPSVVAPVEVAVAVLSPVVKVAAETDGGRALLLLLTLEVLLEVGPLVVLAVLAVVAGLVVPLEVVGQLEVPLEVASLLEVVLALEVASEVPPAVVVVTGKLE